MVTMPSPRRCQSVAFCAAALLLMVVSCAHAFHPGHECGVGHPAVHQHIEAHPKAVSHQQYHTSTPPQGRDLAEQAYSKTAGNAFLPLAQAHSQGLTRPIRVKALWDVVEGGDYTGSRAGTQARQCIAIGANIQVTCASGSLSCWELWGPCTAADVVAPGHAKLTLMKKRVTWVNEYLAKALQVKPILDNITIDSTVADEYVVHICTCTCTHARVCVCGERAHL